MRGKAILSERASARACEVMTLSLAFVLALRAPGLGDYPNDAGPALTAIAHGDFGGFFSHQAVMGPVSLYLRAPFAAIGVALHDGQLGLYRWGALPCLLSVAIFAIWLGRATRARARGTAGGRWALGAQVLIALICLLNPLVNDALYYGHPEELLTASLAGGALLAACERRVLMSTLLLGVAVASKQWAVVIAVPVALALPGNRLRVIAGAGALALLATLPLMIGDLASFRNVVHNVAAAPKAVTPFTWLYPFSPAGLVKLTSIYGGDRLLATHRLVGVESVGRPLITLLSIAIPLLVWWRSRRRFSPQQMLLCACLALVLRCALDSGSEPYYHYPVLVAILLLDLGAARRLPLVGLAGALTAFVVLDRFTGYLSSPVVNVAYVAVTLTACALLVRALRATTAVPGTAGLQAAEPAVA